MTTTPEKFQDFSQLVSKDGIKTDGTWYHGTSSGLISSIQKQGLQGDGDAASNKRTQQTMNSIATQSGGVLPGQQSDLTEPVFLTQSKEVAYFWAEIKTHNRNRYFNNNETATVLAINLPEDLASTIKPDVGGAALLMGPGDDYINFLKKKYDENGLDFNDLSPSPNDRMAYITFLAMAYSNEAISADYISALAAE